MSSRDAQALWACRLTSVRLFGFLFGTVLSGSAVYSYLVGEYKASNDLLTEDIYVRLPAKIVI